MTVASDKCLYRGREAAVAGGVVSLGMRLGLSRLTMLMGLQKYRFGGWVGVGPCVRAGG